MQTLTRLIMIISLVAIFGALAACSSSQATGPATNSPVTVTVSLKAPSVFKISSLAINPAEVYAGVKVLVTAKVTNTGTVDQIYRGNIRIDNTVQASLPAFLSSSEVNIPAGDTQLLSITTTINNPSTYKVTWDDTSQNLVVVPQEIATGDTQNTTPGIAPGFSAGDVITGQNISLSQYQGSVILLNFVNYGCDPSTNQKVGAQLLAIKQLQSQRSDFVPFSVFCGCCPPEVLRQFAKDNNLNWPWILDSDYSIAQKYTNFLKKFGYPTLIFIDKNQSITEVAGYTDLSGLSEKINKIAQ